MNIFTIMDNNTVLGYTTINNSFETLYNKDIAKHDIMLYLNTVKGEVDYDPTFGMSNRKSLFKIKTNALRMILEDEIKEAFKRSETLNLISLNTIDLEKGWQFLTEVSYLNGVPELWSFSADVESQKISLWQGGDE